MRGLGGFFIGLAAFCWPAAGALAQTAPKDVIVIGQSAALSGSQADFGKYGWKMPAARDGLAFAFGVERRKESLTLQTDQTYQQADLAGGGGAMLARSASSARSRPSRCTTWEENVRSRCAAAGSTRMR